jgi:hypothetical protein
VIPRLLPLVPGRDGPWPFAGCFDGLLDDGDPEGPWVAWAGRVGPVADDGRDLDRSWRSSRVVHRALLRGGVPAGDRARMIAALWGRLDPGLVLPGFGPLGAQDPADLALLLLAGDRAGLALSGTGLGSVIGVGAGEVIVEGAHPLLAVRGLPARAGALSVPWGELGRLPRWMVAMAHGDAPALDVPSLRTRCGVPA